MSFIGGPFAATDPAAQGNFNPSWMGQTFNATSGIPRPAGRPIGGNGGEGEEDRPMAAPIFMRNRYGREDVLALYDGGSVHPPDGLDNCPLYYPDPQPPCVIKPLTDIEKKLRENINSSKAMSLLSASERHHITSGGPAPESPQAAPVNRSNSNSNGWTQVPQREHNKTWGRTTSVTGNTPPGRGSVRGAFTGGRGGGTTAGGGGMIMGDGGERGGGGAPPLQTSPYGANSMSMQQNGERSLGTGGTYPSRRGVNPVSRGVGSSAGSSAFNSRAQGLYNPHDPSDRPRQRGRSTSEDGEGGPTTTPIAPGVGGMGTTTVNGGQGIAPGGGGMGTWQQSQQPSSRPSAWGRTDQPQRMPEWATDEDGGMAGGVSRDHSSEVSSGTFDDQGRFMRTPSIQQQQSMHESQQRQRISPQSSMQMNSWSMDRDVPLSAPMDSLSSSHYSMSGVAPSSQQQQQADSSAYIYALQQKQQQIQQQQQQAQAAAQAQAQAQQQAQFAAMQLAQQQLQQQQAAPAAPSKPAVFFYLDPNGVERGPFPLDQMEAWFNMGYFQDSLQVRRESDSDFTALGDLQKINGKNPFKYVEPVAPVMPTPNMLAGYMDHQLGLGQSLGGTASWDTNVQNLFATRPAPTPSYEALLEKQRMEDAQRKITEEREKLMRMQEMMRMQADTEREQQHRLLREKEEGLQKMQDDIARKQREMEEVNREHAAALEKEKREIEMKRAEFEKQNNREKEELKKKQDAERKKIEEIAEKKRIEEARVAAAEEAEREKERAKRRAEETKRNAEEEKKRKEEERKRAEAFARVEELRLEAEREQAVERERQAQIAAARKAAIPPPTSTPTTPVVATPPPIAKSVGPAWGGAGISTASAAAVKKSGSETRSLAEVMAEEERQARAEQRENDRMRKETEVATRPVSSSSKGGVWGGVTPSSIASQATPISSSSSAAWGGAGMNKNVPSKASPWAGPSLSEANKPKALPKPIAPPAKVKAPEKAAKKDEKKKAVSDEAQFTSWFITRAKQLNDTVEAEVLASFIQDIANPDEVEDYMVGYLGEGKQVKEFVRDYIYKRSELRNKKKGGATATSSSHDNDGFSNVAGKKGGNTTAAQKKKAKFVVDSACLGFRPTGDPNRVNQGEIDHPEPSTAGRR